MPIAKILDKLVLSQVSSYINSQNLSNACQSAHRPSHSTETALLKVANDLFLSLTKFNISVLALLHFFQAFDTIGHPILVHRLHTDFRFTDSVIQWFSSYLTDRTQYVTLSYRCSVFILYTQVFLKVQFLALFFSPCNLNLYLPLLIHTQFFC